MSKVILKGYVAASPIERRERLRYFIDHEIREIDINRAIRFVEEQNRSHVIVEMNYSDDGLFFIKLEIGVTYLN